MKKRIVFIILGFFILSLGGIWAGGAKEEPKGPAKVWFNTLFHGGDAKAMEMIVQEFNKKNTDVQIDLTQGSWTEYAAQMNNAVMAGEAPQIGIILNFLMPAMHPALTPLNDSPVGDLLKEYNVKREDYVEYVWDIASIGGKQYGIPLDNTLLGVYYNKDAFRKAGLNPDKPPMTGQEFVDAAEALKKAGFLAFHPGAFGQARWYRRAWFIFFWQKGGELIENNKAAFNNRKGLEALESLVAVRERGWNTPGTNGATQFETGNLGMMMNGTWHYLSMANVKFDWGMMGIPKWFDKQYTWGSNHFLVIPKQAKKAENLIKPAMKAIKFISDNSHLWGIYGGHVPLKKTAMQHPELQQSETWKKTLKNFSDMAFGGIYKSKPLHPKIGEINAAIEPYIERAYNGTLSPKEALALAERDVNAVLSKN
jgi:multiple sugar transport system substrate-binding protein